MTHVLLIVSGAPYGGGCGALTHRTPADNPVDSPDTSVVGPSATMTAVFALGSNGSGQLGIGHCEDVSVPKPVTLSTRPTSPIAAIAAGGNHTLLLTRDGRSVFCSGETTSGACGGLRSEGQPVFRELVSAATPLPHKSPQPSSEQPPDASTGSHPEASASDDLKITHIAATWTTTHLATPTSLYSLGTGSKGELGLGPLIVRVGSLANSLVPEFPPPGTRIVDIAAGMAHVVAVLDNGEAWGWGAARKGQLGSISGIGDQSDEAAAVVHSPRRIPGVGFKVARAACGRDFTVLFGAAETGEFTVLGNDKSRVRSWVPDALPRGWRDVGASWGSAYVLGADGAVLSWGRDDHGQLVPPGLPAIAQIAVGSEHVVALTEEGDVVAWGWGEHGNCGPLTDGKGDVRGRWNVIVSKKYVPPGMKIVGVGAGCATSWIVMEQGQP